MVPEEEVPSDVPGVGEAGLRDLSADGVDDGGLLLRHEEVGDAARHDELRQVHQQLVRHKLFLVDQQY